MNSSFSLDENGNCSSFQVPGCNQPAATSTPRKPPREKKELKKHECPYCGRSYQLKFYYDKHVSSHLNQVSTTDLNVSSAVHLDETDLSFRQLRDGLDNSKDTTVDTANFKTPAAPAQKKTQNAKDKRKPKYICTYCLKPYICGRSYKTHIRTHQIQDAAGRFPDAKKVMENSETIADKALLLVATSPSEGESGSKFKQLVGHIASTTSTSEDWKNFYEKFCKELISSVCDTKCFLPSSLATALIDKLDVLLSCDKFSDLIQALNLSDFENDVLSQFVLEFGLNFTSEMLKFISATFRATSARSIPQQDVELDKEDRQVVYYIAGSIIRGYLKIAKRASKSDTWQNVASVLKSQVLMENPSGDLDPDLEWTKDVDRGRLLYIRQHVQEFFVKLTKLVYANEKKDGSIDFEAVITKVGNSELSIDWSDIISDSLPENVSINLMNDVVLCFCRTCGRGFAKRRLNFLRKRPMVSMPTRHLVASRKNR